MSLLQPRWRDILEFPGYSISEEGDVQCWIFRGRRLSTPRRILPFISKDSRWCVKLMRKGKQEMRSIANLVLYAFQGAPPPGTPATPNGAAIVEFKDGDPFNVNNSNLCWKPLTQNY